MQLSAPLCRHSTTEINLADLVACASTTDAGTDRLPPLVPAHSSQLRALRANTRHAQRERVQKPIWLFRFSREERAAHGEPCTSQPPQQSAHILRVAAGRRSLPRSSPAENAHRPERPSCHAHTTLLPHRGLLRPGAIAGRLSARASCSPTGEVAVLSRRARPRSKLQICCRGGAALERRFLAGNVALERRFRSCGGRHLSCSRQQALSWWRWRALRTLPRMALQRMQPPRPRLSNHHPSRYHLAQCMN